MLYLFGNLVWMLSPSAQVQAFAVLVWVFAAGGTRRCASCPMAPAIATKAAPAPHAMPAGV
jgi:hypothetical protein